MASKEPLSEAALAYASIGLHVFPCRVDLKTPACKNGFHDATTDIEQIKKWWAAQPYNIGIATGASGLVVVDFDLVKGIAVGETNFKKSPDYEPLPETFTVKTRSGGKQYYFRANGTGINSSNSQLCECVDIKAQGGYVIAPPSYVKADDKALGGDYVVENVVKPALLPTWLELKLLDLQKPKIPNLINTDLRSERSNDFPCCEVNIAKLRRAVRNRFQSKDCSGQDEWIKLLFEFRSLIYLVGWTDEQAWSLFDEVCQWEGMGNYDYQNNRTRWEVYDYKPDGKTYKSLLAELSKHTSEPEALFLPTNKDIISPNNEPFSLSMFSLRGQAELMKKQLLDEVFVLAYLAILGQATTIYARANTGKTLLVLWMLVQSIKAGRIKGENVIYINADDTYLGFIQKLELAEEYEFHMLMPNQNGFDPQAIQGYLRQMIENDTARNNIVILDTLKKFTDLMDKKAGSSFMGRVREFIAAGGTVISLAHTNKNKTAEGKSVFCGTSDVVDDCDCVYILETVNTTDDLKVVLFENIKNRGNVAKELAVSYSVSKGISYREKFKSVKLASDLETEEVKVEIATSKELENDNSAIQAITLALDNEEQVSIPKTTLLKLAKQSSDISRRQLLKVLEKYTSVLWLESTGDKNTHSYKLINQPLTLNTVLKK